MLSLCSLHQSRFFRFWLLRSVLTPLWVVLLVISVLTSPGATQTEPDSVTGDERTYDLRVAFETGVPILIEIDRQMEVDARIKIPMMKEKKQKILQKDQLRLVDEYTKWEGGKNWEAFRWYIQSFSTENREIKDKELNGLAVRYWREGDQNFTEVVENRTVLRDTLNGVFKQIDSLAAWLPFPKEARIGDSFDVDFSSLAYLLLDSIGTVSVATGRFTLQSVDGETGCAKLAGTVEFEEESEEDGIEARSSYDLTGKIEIDLNKQLISHLELKGPFEFEGGSSLMTLAGTGKFSLKLEVTFGAAAEKAKKRKPKLREVPRTLPQRKLAFSLPSHWYLSTDDGDTVVFSSSFNSSEEYCHLDLKTFSTGNESMKTIRSEFMGGVRKNFPDVKDKHASSPLGKGISLTLEQKDQNYLIELFPCGTGQTVRIRYYGTDGAFKKTKREYLKFKKSLKLIKSE